MPRRSKWVGQIHAEDSVAKAAQTTLKSRLAMVSDYLPLAAIHADDTPEYVHQLRVSTRRSLAALSLYEELPSRNEAQWFYKWLRRIRKAAGDARDLDVFLQRYENESGEYHKKFLRQIRKRRRKAQRPIVKLHSRLIFRDRFETRANRLLASIAGNASFDKTLLDPWARSKFAHVATRFFQAIPKHPNDVKALHRFRVRGKELRYAMELLSTLFPPEFRTSLYPLVSELQDRLGEVNDHAAARRRLVSWSGETRSRRKADFLRGLISHEDEHLEKSIKRFTNWWTPAFARRLEDSLREMTSHNDPRSGEHQ